MGRIYRAEQAPLGREVALKILHVDGGVPDETFQERFFREASVCARLSHPNTVRIFDYGTDAGVYFIAMEYLIGRTLNDAIRNDGPLSCERSIHVARQIGKSLAQAHGQGVIHRDLKPANVFLAQHGGEEFVKVLDFGLVKAMDSQSHVTRAGNVLGSPAYMAPEQISGADITPATDVYALGVVLYAMLTRALPFKRENPLAVLNAHLHAPPPPFARANPDVVVPDCLEWIVMRCLEKDPTLRFATMTDLDTALRVAWHEIRGTLPAPVQWTLQDGRLDVPFSLEDSTSLTAPRALAPVPAPVDPVPNPPSSPTMEIETGSVQRPVRSFLIALGAVMLLGTGALAAVGGGVWLALSERGSDTPELVAEPVVEPVAEPVAEPVVEPDPVEEPKVEPVMVTPTPRRTTTRKVVAAPEPVVEEPAVEPPVIEEPAPVDEPVAEPVEDPVDEPGTGDEPKSDDDWGSVGPGSDLKDPWSK